MDIALTFALARAHAACQASLSLDACRTLGLDCTKMAQRSYQWTARTGLPSAARWRRSGGGRVVLKNEA